MSVGPVELTPNDPLGEHSTSEYTDLSTPINNLPLSRSGHPVSGVKEGEPWEVPDKPEEVSYHRPKVLDVTSRSTSTYCKNTTSERSVYHSEDDTRQPVSTVL